MPDSSISEPIGSAPREPPWTAALAATLHANVHAMEHVFPVVLPLLIAEFHADVKVLGAVGTAAYVTMGLGGLPAGWLSDRIGPRRALLVGTAMCAIGCASVTLSTAAWVAASALSLLGVGLGLYHPAGMALLSRTYRSFHGWSLGIHGAGGAVAMVVAPSLVGGMAALWGWRVAYLIAAGGCVILGLALLALPETRPLLREPADPANAGPPGAGHRAVTWKTFALLLGETAFAGLVYRGVATFLPLYYSSEVVPSIPERFLDLLGAGIHGSALSPAAAAAVGGTLASVTYASAIVGQAAGGWAASSRRPLAWLVGIGFVYTVALLLMGLAKGVPVLAAGMLFASCYFASQPITNMLVARTCSGEKHGMMYGIYFTVGFGVGSLAPLVTGLLSGKGSLASVFLMLVVAGAGALILRIVLLKTAGPLTTMSGRR